MDFIFNTSGGGVIWLHKCYHECFFNEGEGHVQFKPAIMDLMRNKKARSDQGKVSDRNSNFISNKDVEHVTITTIISIVPPAKRKMSCCHKLTSKLSQSRKQLCKLLYKSN